MMKLRILCIGDVVGDAGRRFLKQRLSSFKRQEKIDLVICNGENSAHSNGITKNSADALFAYGVDVITLGNHSFRRKEIFPYLENHPYIVRPLNFPSSQTPGKGYCIVDMGYTTVAVVNLMGQEGIGAGVDNPFLWADRALKEIDAKVIMVDFHAEATSEKRAMGFYLDGRVSAVFGTHTHVLTADAEILSGGTGYITDIGMTGPIDSVLGVKKDIILRRFITKLPEKFEFDEGESKLDCAIFEIDEKTGRCIAVTGKEIR